MHTQGCIGSFLTALSCDPTPACLLQPIVVVRFCPVLLKRDGDMPQEQQQEQQQQGAAGEGAGEAAAVAPAPHPFDLPYRMVFAVSCCYPCCYPCCPLLHCCCWLPVSA